jgi:hypothetical protein
MIATCKFSRSSELSDHQRGRFAGFDEEFAVTVGLDYIVLGVGIWETVLQVLVRDDDGLPSWCPAGLFALPVQPIPGGWMCGLGDRISAAGADLWTRWVVKLGYAELVVDERHSDLLMERDPEALAVFERAWRHLAEQES